MRIKKNIFILVITLLLLFLDFGNVVMAIDYEAGYEIIDFEEITNGVFDFPEEVYKKSGTVVLYVNDYDGKALPYLNIKVSQYDEDGEKIYASDLELDFGIRGRVSPSRYDLEYTVNREYTGFYKTLEPFPKLHVVKSFPASGFNGYENFGVRLDVFGNEIVFYSIIEGEEEPLGHIEIVPEDQLEGYSNLGLRCIVFPSIFSVDGGIDGFLAYSGSIGGDFEVGEDEYKIHITGITKRWRSMLQKWEYSLGGYVETLDKTKLVTGKFSIAQQMDKKLLLWDNNSFEYMYNDLLFGWNGKSSNNYEYLDLTFVPNDSKYKVAHFRVDLSDVEGLSMWESHPLEIDTIENEELFTDYEDFFTDYEQYYDEETGQFEGEFWNIIRDMLIEEGTVVPEKKTLDEWLDGSGAEQETVGLLDRLIQIVTAPFTLISKIISAVIYNLENLIKDSGELFALYSQFFAWVPEEIISIFVLGAGFVVVLRVLGR